MLRFERPVLMWVTNRKSSDAPLPELADAISRAGADLVQVRESALDDADLERLVIEIERSVIAPTLVLLNSHLSIAARLGIGIHLPEAGPSISEARAVLGSEATIGRSVHSPASAADSEGATYLIAGHVYETSSKAGLPAMGLSGFETIVRAAPSPVLAIGGVTAERVPELIEHGAAGVAVMGPLTHVRSAAATTERYRIALDKTMTKTEPQTIQATINGKDVQMAAGTTVSQFLASRELHERLVVVERNGEILKRDSFGVTEIEAGDLLEIVHFVGGG